MATEPNSRRGRVSVSVQCAHAQTLTAMISICCADRCDLYSGIGLGEIAQALREYAHCKTVHPFKTESFILSARPHKTAIRVPCSIREASENVYYTCDKRNR
jgi:hypothetical protein